MIAIDQVLYELTQDASASESEKAQKKIALKNVSESDRKIPDKKPKWQFSGKMDVRKTHNKR